MSEMSMNLKNFIQNFPNLDNKFGIGENSTNGRGAALQRNNTSANERGVSGKRKRNDKSEIFGGKRRRDNL